MNKPAVCIATIRPDSYQQWLAAWKDEFQKEGVEVFTMVDADDQGAFAKVPDVMGPVYDHKIVAAELGDKAWIIPKRTSACKSFAIYKAWKAGCDPVMVLDDDCLPGQKKLSWTGQHKRNLFGRQTTDHYAWNTIDYFEARGLPKIEPAEIVLSHGLWLENPDVDASYFLHEQSRIQEVIDNGYDYLKHGHPPMGALFPMSGMNLAFRREIAPLMYFGLQGPDWGVDRFDDIWCGFLAKKVLDYCGYAVWSGTPYVRHVKASDPFVNIVKEAPGYKMNVELYQWLNRPHCGTLFLNDNETISGVESDNRTILGAMRRIGFNLAAYGPDDGNGYWSKYGDAIHEWLDLFEPEEAFGI